LSGVAFSGKPESLDKSGNSNMVREKSGEEGEKVGGGKSWDFYHWESFGVLIFGVVTNMNFACSRF